MQVTTVLLDAGGVILDETEHEAVRAEIIAATLAAVIPGYDAEAYWSNIDDAVESFCPNTYAYVFWKHLRNDRVLFDELYARHLKVFRRRRPPLMLSSGLEREVKEISHRFKLGIAGQYGHEILDLLKEQAILECFAYRLTQDDFPLTKPDPRYYERILQAIDADARQCVMVGNRIDKDIIPAKQLGMKTVLVRAGLHKNQQPRTPFEAPDAELHGVNGLAAAVQRVAEDAAG